MASRTRHSASEEERRQKIRTLTVATIASGTAAVVTSQFWIAGTWMAAAVTPVLVTLISEMLHKPTTVIASRMTTERDEVLPERARSEPGSKDADPAEPPVNVYRSGGGRARVRAPKKKVAIGAVVAIGVLAFAITAVAITGTELITGGSIGKGANRTTLLGGSKSDSQSDERQDTTTEQQETTTGEQQQTTPEEQTTPQEQQTTPEEQVPEQTTPQQQTVPAPQPPTTTTP